MSKSRFLVEVAMLRFILVNDRTPRSDALVLLQGHGELHQGDRYEVLLLQLRLFH